MVNVSNKGNDLNYYDSFGVVKLRYLDQAKKVNKSHTIKGTNLR